MAPSLVGHAIDGNSTMGVYLLVWDSYSGGASGSGHWALYFDASDPKDPTFASNIDRSGEKITINKFFGLIIHVGASTSRKMVYFHTEEWIGPAPETGTSFCLSSCVFGAHVNALIPS